MQLQSCVGGGHILNFNDNNAVTNLNIHDVTLIQLNAAKAVIYDPNTTAFTGFWENHIHDFIMSYPASSTIPAIDISTDYVNNVLIENFVSTGANMSAGTYAIWIEQRHANTLGVNVTVKH